jgi:TolA-binding protein
MTCIPPRPKLLSPSGGRAARWGACALAALVALPLARADRPAVPAALAGGGEVETEMQGLLRLGTTLSSRGDYGTAEIAYWQILKNPDSGLPDKKDALLGLAHLHRRQGALTKAAAIYEKYVKDYPDDERVPDALLELGRTLRDMGVNRMAIGCFYSVINSTLKFPAQGFEHYQALAKTAQFEIAQTYFEAGDFAAAGKYFSRVRLLDLAPADRARAHFMAAFSQQLGGDLETSVMTLRSFLVDWPADKNVPEARYLLATNLRQLNRPQEALAVTFELLRAEHANSAADPQRWSYWQRRTGNEVANEFFQSGDTFNALAIYQGLSGLSDNPAWRLPVTYQIALCEERLRQLDRARAAYAMIVAAGQSAAGQPAAGEVADLAQMAAWRLAHLDWQDQADRKFSTLFPLPEKTPSAPPAPPPPQPTS